MQVDMLFRLSLVVAFVVYILNLGDAFGLGVFNAAEKGFFLLAAIIGLATRPFSRTVMGLLAATLILTTFLAAATTYPGFKWSIYINSLNQFIIIYALLAVRTDAQDRLWFLATMSLLPLASVMIGVVYDAAGINRLWSQEFASGALRLRGSLIPAYLSGLGAAGLFASLVLALGGRKIFYAALAANFAILLLAGGRMALMVAVFACILTFYLKPEVNARLKIYGTLAGFVGMVAVLAIFGGVLMERLEGSSDSGREGMWAFLDTIIAQYPETGIGYGHQFWSVPREVMILFGSNAAHNDYLRLMVELGQAGMILFYLLLTAAVLRVWASPQVRYDPAILAGYAGFLIISITDNVLSSPSFFPIILIGAMAAARNGQAASRPAPAPRAALKPFDNPRRARRIRAVSRR